MEEEENQIIGKLMKDRSAARKRLICLQTKAQNMASDVVLAIAELLKGEKTGHLKDGVFYLHRNPHEMSVNKSVVWPTDEDIQEVLVDIEKTKKEADSLEDRYRSLRL